MEQKKWDRNLDSQ